MRRDKPAGGLVYSTATGRMCPACRQPIPQCVCSRKTSAPATDGIVRVSSESKGRAGRNVTVIKGLALDASALQQLGTQLKTLCGSGGTVKDGAIVVQGDHCDRVIEILRAQGWVVKRTGG